jgi:hypothetical protein
MLYQSASLAWCQALIWGPRSDFYSCQTVAGLLMWGGSVVYNCCWPLPAQSFSGSGPSGLMTKFFCLEFETPPTWRTRPPYLYPPGIGWPSYTSRHWVPFSSPHMTRRATVEVFEFAPKRRNFSSIIAVFSYCRKNMLVFGAVT